MFCGVKINPWQRKTECEGIGTRIPTQAYEYTSIYLRQLLFSLAYKKLFCYVANTNLSRNTATEVVVSSAGVEELVMEFNEASEKEHLGLAPARDGIPGLEALGGDGGKVEASGELAGEAEAGADGPPADEGGHGNAAVLDLGVAEPGDGLVRSEVGEAEGIPLLAELDAVGLGEDGLAGHAGVRGCGGSRGRGGLLLGSLLGGGLLLGHEDGGGNAGNIGGLGSRHEGRGGASKSSKGQERQLHFGYVCILACSVLFAFGATITMHPAVAAAAAAIDVAPCLQGAVVEEANLAILLLWRFILGFG